MMKELRDYIRDHTVRVTEPPTNDSTDMIFFYVQVTNEPDATKLKELIQHDSNQAVFGDGVDMFDGEEHGYIEIGGWIGDQELALRLMGLGSVLGLWVVLSPRLIPVGEELQLEMAKSGMLTIKSLSKKSLSKDGIFKKK